MSALTLQQLEQLLNGLLQPESVKEATKLLNKYLKQFSTSLLLFQILQHHTQASVNLMN